MSYYGDGPNWAMIGAKRRAEREASSAHASAGRWKQRAEDLATLVYATAERTCPTHTAGDCQCRACWERRVAAVFGTGMGSGPGRASGADPAAAFWDLVNKVNREAKGRGERA
ncbi:hypothetical protein ACIRJL_09375 [Streptomyces sp. NPDC102383]|uniref:hypothetical protein n=1 Tax=Streptomyces sp. NPDC102383 TaxID=3366165 RepID=UPI0038168965